MSGAAAAGGAGVAGFVAAFGAEPVNAAETTAKQEAEAAIAQLRKLVATAAQLIARQNDDDKAAHPLGGIAGVADGLHARVAPVAETATATARSAAYKRITTDAKAAAATAQTAIAGARSALAAAAKQQIDAEAAPGGKAARLRDLAADPGGRQVIDAMVAGIGSSAGTPAAKTFVAEALKNQEFDVELTGDLSSKALPRLYALLGRVPDSHTRDNEGLQRINRVKARGTSDYAAGGVINLRCGRSGASPHQNILKNVEGIGAGQSFRFHHIARGRPLGEPPLPLGRARRLAGRGHGRAQEHHHGNQGFRRRRRYPAKFLRLYVDAMLQKHDPATNDNVKKAWAEARARQQSAVTRAELLADGGIAALQRVRAIADRQYQIAAQRDLETQAAISTLAGPRKVVGEVVCQRMLRDPTLSRPRRPSMPRSPS